jgi:hypothetical protein
LDLRFWIAEVNSNPGPSRRLLFRLRTLNPKSKIGNPKSDHRGLAKTAESVSGVSTSPWM